MKRIQVDVLPSGDVKIESLNFKGSACEAATKFLEEALGAKVSDVRKSEFYENEINVDVELGNGS